MRTSLLAGISLALTTALLVVVSALSGLELESVALLGAAAGAVIALVPDRSAVARLAGFAGGIVAAWVGFLLRAAVLPDSTSGRAVFAALVVLLCVAVVAVARGRVALWSVLLGAAALAGGYELAYQAAPPEVAATSLSAVTSLVLAAAVGFFAAALVPARAESRPVIPADAAELAASRETVLETTP